MAPIRAQGANVKSGIQHRRTEYVPQIKSSEEIPKRESSPN